MEGRSGRRRRVSNDEAIEAARGVRLEPLEAYPGHTKVHWRCRCMECGDLVSIVFNKIQQGRRGCRRCGYASSSQVQRMPIEQALSVMRASGAEPLDPYPGAHKPWRARCMRCGRIVTPTLSSARTQGPCVYCGKNKVDIAEVFTAMMSADLDPLEVFPGSDMPWSCQCRRCLRIVTPRYSSIKRGQGGCVYCAGVRVDPTEALIAMRRADLEPLEPYPGNSKKPWRSRCGRCGAVVLPRYNMIQQGLSRGCAPCGRARGGMARRVDEREANEIMLSAECLPLEPYPTMRVPWRCRCLRCGQEIFPMFGNVRRGQRACAYCAGHRVEAAVAVSRMVKGGVKPLVDFPGSDEPWESQCMSPGCGAIVKPRYSSIKAGQGGCVNCATYGFKNEYPSFVYLVVSVNWAAIKIGIANVGSVRLQSHAAYGWMPHGRAKGVSTWNLQNGRDARYIEREVIGWWRDQLGAIRMLGSEQMPQGGYRETAFLADVDARLTAEKVDGFVAELAGRSVE